MKFAFEPSRNYRALLLADVLAFAVFFLLPQFEVVESIAAQSALELDGLGGLIAPAHPLSIAVHVSVRVLLLGLLFFGHWLGLYVLIAGVFLSCLSATIGGLSVLTALDLLALTVLYLLDGYLLCSTIQARAYEQRRA